MVKLQKQNVYGTTQFVDKRHNIQAVQVNDKWYFQKDGKLHFTAGLVNINCGVNILSHEDEYEECLNMVGFHRADPAKFEFELHDNNVSSYVSITSKGNFYVVTEYNQNTEDFETPNFDSLIQYLIQLEDRLNIEVFEVIALLGSSTPIQAASSRDFVKNNLVRVKSSNVWAYGIDIKDRKDKFGTVYVQFKNEKGGPGAVYCYYEVPIKSVWQKGLSAPSKGHWVHKYLRDNFPYRKLSGDRKGKLPNAIN